MNNHVGRLGPWIWRQTWKIPGKRMVRQMLLVDTCIKKPKHSMQLDLKSFLETCLCPMLKMMAIWQSVLERLIQNSGIQFRNSGVSFQPCFIMRLKYWGKLFGVWRLDVKELNSWKSYKSVFWSARDLRIFRFPRFSLKYHECMLPFSFLKGIHFACFFSSHKNNTPLCKSQDPLHI